MWARRAFWFASDSLTVPISIRSVTEIKDDGSPLFQNQLFHSSFMTIYCCDQWIVLGEVHGAIVENNGKVTCKIRHLS